MASMFKLNPAAGQPLYVQLMHQIRHAIETGVLRDGDLLPGIRTLAQELVVSHNTVVKAYSELEHEGLLELRHGSGAFISARSKSKAHAERMRIAQQKVGDLVAWLRRDGWSADEISRLFEAEIFYSTSNRRRS
jgi:GntR family transcriptional regulator